MFSKNWKAQTPTDKIYQNRFRVVFLILIILISIIIVSCMNTASIKPEKIIFPNQSWLSNSGSRNLIVRTNASDVTESVKEQDGKFVSLKEKLVPTDINDEQTLLVSFKDDQLPGSYVFRISAGSTKGVAKGWLDVDEFSLVENDEKKSLRIVYKANQAYPIEVLYSRSPEFKSIWFGEPRPIKNEIFYAFPISLPMAGVSEMEIPTSLLSSARWNTAIIPLPPKLEEQAQLIDEAQQFLEALNNSFSSADRKKEGMFFWDESLLSETAIKNLAAQFMIAGKRPTVRLFYGIKEISTGFSAPIIDQSIVVQTQDGKLKTGDVGISY
jgi:hypothetical protein